MTNLALKEIEELKLLVQFNKDGLMSVELKDESPETLNKVYSLLDWQLEYNIRNKSNKHLAIVLVHCEERSRVPVKVNYFASVNRGKLTTRLEAVPNTKKINIV